MEPSVNQKSAIECLDNPCVVSAGAGSGKTYTLTKKFSYLIEKGYDPERILCITFTNKAANELKKRVIESTKINWFDIKWVRTIHSACLEMIKPYLEQLGFKENISIYSSYEQKKIIRQTLYNHRLDIKKFTMPITNLISDAKDNFDPIKYIENVNIKKYKIISEELMPKVNDERYILTEIFNEYNKTLLDNNAMDFDDILFYTFKLLQNIIRKRSYQDHFQYIMVDEFQDVNNIQYNIIMSLVQNGNLTIVGDDFQSIFGWRGAKPDFFINAKDQIENSQLFKLEQNYRSIKNIVEMSNSIIKRNTRQIPKKCYSIIESDIKPIIIHFKDDVQEAKQIAETCQQAVNKLNYSFNDIAILYRAKFISRGIEKALTDFMIPYTIIGAVAFFERREIKDLMSYLKFAHNTQDNESFTRSISTPKRGIGKTTLQKIQKKDGITLLHKLYNSVSSLSNKTTTEVLKYYRLINTIINKKPYDAIVEVINKTNFKDELKSISTDEDDLIDRKENVMELLNFASKFEKISDLIDESSLMTSDDNEDTEKVKLMTVHSAKGLEFKIVFVIGLEDGLFPHWKSLKSDKDLDTIDHLEEERRLFYVATTRAKERLIITNVKQRSCSFSDKSSRFIDEIKEHCNVFKT